LTFNVYLIKKIKALPLLPFAEDGCRELGELLNNLPECNIQNFKTALETDVDYAKFLAHRDVVLDYVSTWLDIVCALKLLYQRIKTAWNKIIVKEEQHLDLDELLTILMLLLPDEISVLKELHLRLSKAYCFGAGETEAMLLNLYGAIEIKIKCAQEKELVNINKNTLVVTDEFCNQEKIHSLINICYAYLNYTHDLFTTTLNREDDLARMYYLQLHPQANLSLMQVIMNDLQNGCMMLGDIPKLKQYFHKHQLIQSLLNCLKPDKHVHSQDKLSAFKKEFNRHKLVLEQNATHEELNYLEKICNAFHMRETWIPLPFYTFYHCLPAALRRKKIYQLEDIGNWLTSSERVQYPFSFFNAKPDTALVAEQPTLDMRPK
jgi:hypothetical protein